MSNINESAANLWTTFNKQFYQKFDMHFTGFIIQGVSGKITSGEHTYLCCISHCTVVLCIEELLGDDDM